MRTMRAINLFVEAEPFQFSCVFCAEIVKDPGSAWYHLRNIHGAIGPWRDVKVKQRVMRCEKL